MTRKTPGPPCVICGQSSVAKNMCDMHYRRFKATGDALKTKRPDDWGKRNNHPLNDTWRVTKRVKEGRVERWDDFYLFLEDVGEKQAANHRLKRLDPRAPFGPENYYWMATSILESDAERQNKNAAYQRAWRLRNPDRAKSYDLKRHFGVTLEEYAEMNLRQNGVCAICHQKDKHRSLAVDHCHTTGKVRGLLCSPCNKAIGALGDSVERLQSAIRYLEASR